MSHRTAPLQRHNTPHLARGARRFRKVRLVLAAALGHVELRRGPLGSAAVDLARLQKPAGSKHPDRRGNLREFQFLGETMQRAFPRPLRADNQLVICSESTPKGDRNKRISAPRKRIRCVSQTVRNRSGPRSQTLKIFEPVAAYSPLYRVKGDANGHAPFGTHRPEGERK